MIRRITWDQLVELVEGDREFVAVLVEHGLIEDSEEGVQAIDVDRALVCRTLLRELEVNLPGIEIILRMREELAQARRRILELELAREQPKVTGK
jgi:hypothetical protein